MSLSARRPLEDTLTTSPSSSSIAKERRWQREYDSMLKPLREKVQGVLLDFHNVIAEVETQYAGNNWYSEQNHFVNRKCQKTFLWLKLCTITLQVRIFKLLWLLVAKCLATRALFNFHFHLNYGQTQEEALAPKLRFNGDVILRSLHHSTWKTLYIWQQSDGKAEVYNSQWPNFFRRIILNYSLTAQPQKHVHMSTSKTTIRPIWCCGLQSHLSFFQPFNCLNEWRTMGHQTDHDVLSRHTLLSSNSLTKNPQRKVIHWSVSCKIQHTRLYWLSVAILQERGTA